MTERRWAALWKRAAKKWRREALMLSKELQGMEKAADYWLHETFRLRGCLSRISKLIENAKKGIEND